MKMLRRRPALTAASRPGRFPIESTTVELVATARQPPRALLRSYAAPRDRRARSQPLAHLNAVAVAATASGSDDDDDADLCDARLAAAAVGLRSRLDVSTACRFSIDSTSADSGIRSSTHSHSSAATTSASSVEERHVSVTNRDFSLSCILQSTPPLAEAIFDHIAMSPDELPFNAGDTITILDQVSVDDCC